MTENYVLIEKADRLYTITKIVLKPSSNTIENYFEINGSLVKGNDEIYRHKAEHKVLGTRSIL